MGVPLCLYKVYYNLVQMSTICAKFDTGLPHMGLVWYTEVSGVFASTDLCTVNL